jgi:transcriptional regulator GlxA family with amidase domain
MKKNLEKKFKHIVILTPPNTSILDVAGPLEVFSKTANYIEENPGKYPFTYKTHVLSTDKAGILETSSGMPIVCEGNLFSVDYKIDTLLVTGNANAHLYPSFDEMINWLKTNWKKIRRVGSVCAGAFILAKAGILDGKRATTHWERCALLAEMFPSIKVEPDPIFVKDGSVYTSAGISTGMDLALAMVEEDYGREVALYIARRLVLYLKRPGNQSQFSIALTYQKTDYQPIKELQTWMAEHLNEELTIEMLAEKASMSPRNFARVFTRETGITPGKYIEKLRLEAARRRLEETHLTINEISDECGLGGADTMRRVFLRNFKTTPTDYRRSFKTSLN